MAITESQLYKLLDRILFLNIATTLVLTIGAALLAAQYARIGDTSTLAGLIINIALAPLLCLALWLTHRIKPNSAPMAMIVPELISALLAISSGGMAITNTVQRIIGGDPPGGLPLFQFAMFAVFALSTGLSVALTVVSDKLRRSLSSESSSGEEEIQYDTNRRDVSQAQS